jgi:predicted enzyme related to lactoylglutathione lyase
MADAINWFEIPAADFDRAVKFYGDILNRPLRKEIFGGIPNGIFETDDPDAVGGAIVFSEQYQPSTSGAVVYLNAGHELDAVLSRVDAAGGRVVLPKTDIGDPGYIALILDTEGNKVGLHQPR